MAKQNPLSLAQNHMSTDQMSTYIRWFFSCFVLSFIAIIISGLFLTQIPVFRMKSMRGNQLIRFITVIVNITAYGDAAVVGLGGFL